MDRNLNLQIFHVRINNNIVHTIQTLWWTCDILFQRESSKGSVRTTLGAKKPDFHMRLKSKRRPPRGMFMSNDDLIAIVTGPTGQGDALLRQLDGELVSLKRQVKKMDDNTLV